ncbi:hypothetical protein BJY01DRAFT_249877 [Aspergillus pseudoustus]|uniref:Rhodopsin domain-containing protein n=1 Tax=Aspergillus pseudoustus TaxID=1810923 RepID=A0ABR4JNI3_9EURO
MATSNAAAEVDLTESHAVEVNVVAWVFTGIAIATVALKLAARQIVNRVGWDDFFIFFSLGLSIIAAAFVSHSVTLGLGKHTAAVIAEHGMERVTLTSYWQILGYPFNIGSFSFPNISIAILINNLLDPNPLRARLLIGMSILQVVIAMVSVFLIFLQCRPTRALWDHTIATADCWPQSVLYDFSYWVSAYTTVTDIVLAAVPISVFWKLQMRRSTKLAVCVMMGLTLLSAVVTVVKATYLPLFTDAEDPLYNVTPLVIWGLIEQNVVIVAACIPTLRPFFRRAFESTKGSSANDNKTSSTRGRSGSAFKLSSNPTHSGGSKRMPSVSEIPLEETGHGHGHSHEHEHDGYGYGYDVERGSSSSQRGIWQTREVIVESFQEAGETERERERRQIVPANLR